MLCESAVQVVVYVVVANLDSGEMTFSKRFGFLESGEDVENMMYHTGRAMDWIGMVGLLVAFDQGTSANEPYRLDKSRTLTSGYV